MNMMITIIMILNNYDFNDFNDFEGRGGYASPMASSN